MGTPLLITPTKSAYNPGLLIKSILDQCLHFEPEKEIHYRDLYKMNYRDLHSRVSKLANSLRELGVKAGDVVGVLDFDSHRYLELYFAVPMIGAVLHTINYRLSPEQISYTMNHAEDKVVFCHKTLLPLIIGIKSTLTTVEKYVLLKDDEAALDDVSFLSGEYEELLSRQKDEYSFPDMDENTMATLFYTTGTTGQPKGVCFSHRQLVLHTMVVANSLCAIDSPVRIHSTNVYMPLTPMFHVHAWGMPYVATMLGMKQVYPGPYEPEMLMKLILTHTVSFSHCVPTILGILVNNPKVKSLDLSFFRVIIGGSALPFGLAKSTLDLGIDIISGYGMSETCPVLTLPYIPTDTLNTLTIEEATAERIKTGRPILFVDLKLMDDAGNFLPFDGKTVGEIVVRAPWLTQTYYKETERSEELWQFGYMHTGDMAWVEPNGTVVICDRKKDVIKSGGEWISSLAIESLISSYLGVKETAIIGVPDEKWGERPLALVVLGDGVNVSNEDLKNHLQQFVDTGQISKWAVPDIVKFVKEIPKTSVGKIDKKLIRVLIEKNEI
ncbi:MAG TPA: long-chain fatty acid--CoA ligase [Niabella sp.]|nr:long-chain fatty acid--CoA ligase [Niabella sp.]HOZ95744.1 long-chain fatty acid--CoA ligase [Niabella sp.]HQW15987.1 long-chain fatty acid--CoA ligase [Niabella sp.]HQX21160.1 long-chain fatty acid--CoA ligase [Niabella sp.]HRB36547.1 long-chain fatty acid--CoA ligase [Niabella sp.]